jgi:hypothetical protein
MGRGSAPLGRRQTEGDVPNPAGARLMHDHSQLR